MKNIKRLGITTIEGFEVRDLQRFPSMEWGDEGGMKAVLYYKGNQIMQVLQEGNGGPAITYTSDYYREHKTEIDLQCLRFLKRVDESYGPNSKYDWLRDKKVDQINDDDWEAVVNNIEEYYDDVKGAAKQFRAGYKAVVVLKTDCQTSYLSYRVSDVTKDEVKQWLAQNDTANRYNHDNIRILKPEVELNTL